MKIAADLHFPMRDATQPMVHLEAAVMQMATLEPGETLALLLERLEALEKRLSTGGPGVAAGTSGAPRPELSGARPLGGQQSSPVLKADAAPGRPSGARSPSPPAPARYSSARSAIPGSASSQDTPPDSPGAASAFSTPASSTATLVEDAPRLDAEIEGRWGRVIESINAQKRMLGAFLQESRIVGVTSQALVLAMDALHRSVVDERDNRALVERVLAETFGSPLVLQCALETDATERPQAADLKPLVDRAIAWFEGDVIQPSGDAGRSPR
jgi:DNA polymerase-3 subunit gamma/tau